jgi:hypothetical protein
LEPLTPVYTAELFAPLSAELVALLRGLGESDWTKPTVAGAWRVKDVARAPARRTAAQLAFGRDAAHFGRGPASGAYARRRRVHQRAQRRRVSATPRG